MGHPLISRSRFSRGYSAITSDHSLCGIEFGILKLDPGEVFRYESDARESAWVLLHGSVAAKIGPKSRQLTRTSLFDQNPWVVHLSAKTPLEFQARESGAELAVAKTLNNRAFAPQIFTPAEVPTEFRGKGLAQDACLRQVRQVFDLSNRPESQLVLGEVVNYPGRWSSYPPHHHDQPEIYHYRFTEPQGYGHAELGDDVYKVRNGDTICIDGGQDHSQVSAPGYGMYYLWVVRHLPGKPYRGFEFTEEHKWMLDPKSQGWMPPQ
jgi:5-deoxy-glucuronate isomerase